MTKNSSSWKRKELIFLILYAIFFYAFIIYRSLKLSDEFSRQLYGLRPGWLFGNVNVYVSLISLLFNQLIYQDVSDAQWRNFRGNLPVLTAVFTIFSLLAHALKASFHFKARGMSFVWLLISSAYLSYLHGACILFIITIASVNYILVKIFAGTKLFSFVIWIFNLCFLICNRIYEGYAFSLFGPQLTYLDNLRGTFRWHICFNFVVLRMISFGYDYHWAHQNSHFDHEKHFQRCNVCKSGQTCYLVLQERSIDNDKFSYTIYLSYLVYAPLYISGPILSFKAFASQLDTPQTSYSMKEVIIYGSRLLSSFLLMELMTHLFFYNAFAVSGVWEQLSPVDIFIVGYGVLNFMWLKFLLIWRYFRLWSLINGIETPENMPRCINNCHNLESFWKNWHASYNKWLVRYMYIPLGGSKRKLLNVWVIFTFVALWHDLEWKLLSWAWLTCIFFIPEMILKSAANAFQAESAFGQFVFRELSAVAGSVTITCLMVANLVGYVIGPSGVNLLISRFLTKEGLPVLGGMLITFYIGTKLMFHISDATNRKQ